MKERPILFSGPMVRAILEGRKTQTRRVVKPRIIPIVEECFRVNGKWCNHTLDYDLVDLCPYGQPGDRLWVRETFSFNPEENENEASLIYRADELWDGAYTGLKWKPSIFMPRWASRITLGIVSVRVERLQELTYDDAYAEGVIRSEGDCLDHFMGFKRGNPVRAFEQGWNSINADRGYSWDSNPWVWVIEFRREK